MLERFSPARLLGQQPIRRGTSLSEESATSSFSCKGGSFRDGTSKDPLSPIKYNETTSYEVVCEIRIRAILRANKVEYRRLLTIILANKQWN